MYVCEYVCGVVCVRVCMCVLCGVYAFVCVCMDVNQAPGIKKLPAEQGRMFYSESGRRGQLRQVEQEGFVKDKVVRSGASIHTH